MNLIEGTAEVQKIAPFQKLEQTREGCQLPKDLGYDANIQPLLKQPNQCKEYAAGKKGCNTYERKP